MPRKDKTGPMGIGARTGRGLGTCDGSSALARCAGPGRGMGRTMGRGMNFNQEETQTSKEILTSQKELLKERLNLIQKELENLDD